ncbi:hypothetical protein [Ferruginivarius sediminum]|uniref:Uncharacterized protein n=1 Tax=Ferruginivarius sediminum TaxID=2661937 RepID=A0A369TA05_9PROT|nr:hypothetical protein [Ferruginivarius sediminum]RDD61007.1 hypothetical protein DRB17_14875 [Ferruginivarius sediminum]
MMRRLEDTLLELIESMRPRGEAAAIVRIDDVAFDLPLEVAVSPTLEILADFPRSRWRGGFDIAPSRCRISVRSVEHKS